MRKINGEDGPPLFVLSLYIYTARRLKLIFETCSYPTTAVVKLQFFDLKGRLLIFWYLKIKLNFNYS